MYSKSQYYHYERSDYHNSTDTPERSVFNVGGNRNADIALKLQGNSDRFLSTIQIGITLIGILTGLFSGATIASEISDYFVKLGMSPKPALNLSRIIIVTLVTYLSIVVGELVPKRIGMGKADTIAKIMARPMRLLSVIAYPIVWVL